MKKKEPQNFTARSTGHASPVDSALLFGHQGLEVGKLEEALVEVMQVENTHQQEGSGNENPGEQHSQAKRLQPEVIQSINVKKNKTPKRKNPESDVKQLVTIQK